MRVGIIPSRMDERNYSASCRAHALTRHIDFCELYKVGTKYDLVLVQKRFDVKLMARLKKEGHVVVLDTCDILEAHPDLSVCLEMADHVIVPTEMMRSDIIARHGKSVFTAFDIMEMDGFTKPSAPPRNRTLCVYGTFHNVKMLSMIEDQVRDIMDEVIVVTDADQHHDLAKKMFADFAIPVTVERWSWDTLPSHISRSCVSLMLYCDNYSGVFKSCNRTLLSMRAGRPVLSGWNAQVVSLALSNKLIRVFSKSDQVAKALDELVVKAHAMTEEDASSLAEFADSCRYGFRGAIDSWLLTFSEIAKKEQG